MSKRHYHTPASGHDHTIPSDIPFRSDLVFYAPMTEQCCCDYVSGCVPTTDTNGGSTTDFGSCKWDSVVGMWKCRCQQRTDAYNGFYAALRYANLDLYTGVGTDNITNRGITLFMQTYQTACRGNRYASWIGVDDWDVCCPASHGQAASVIVTTGSFAQIRGVAYKTGGGTQTTPALTTLTKCCVTYDTNKVMRWYKNGSQTATATWGNNMISNPTSCAIMQIQRGQYYEENYVKDVRIYNRVLTQAEIRQL